MDNTDISGLLLLDKPQGITSFKAINLIKNVIGAKKCCHCGSLDPMATGLLLVLINNAVKKQAQFIKCDKTYRASIILGVSTDTFDLDGQIISKKDVSYIKASDIEKVLENFRGEIEQTPPMFSALKVGGKKLYELARKGITIDRKPRKVIIKKIEFLSFKDGIIDLLIECSSGTYIRSIADDLGNLLKCGGALSSLRRLQISSFNVEDALGEADFKDVQKIISKIIIFSS